MSAEQNQSVDPDDDALPLHEHAYREALAAQNYEPCGLRFLDSTSGRHMMYVTEQEPRAELRGKLCWQHPEGQWVTSRMAFPSERLALAIGHHCSLISLELVRETEIGDHLETIALRDLPPLPSQRPAGWKGYVPPEAPALREDGTSHEETLIRLRNAQRVPFSVASRSLAKQAARLLEQARPALISEGIERSDLAILFDAERILAAIAIGEKRTRMRGQP